MEGYANGVTFAVNDVEVAAEALSECHLRDGVSRLVGTKVEACAGSSQWKRYAPC